MFAGQKIHENQNASSLMDIMSKTRAVRFRGNTIAHFMTKMTNMILSVKKKNFRFAVQYNCKKTNICV